MKGNFGKGLWFFVNEDDDDEDEGEEKSTNRDATLLML